MMFWLGKLPVVASSTLVQDKIVTSTNRNATVVTPKKGLFSEFQFKGFALSMQKTLTDMTGMAIGVKIPVTPNFPNYESKIYLPRVTAFVGVGLPASVRVSMTMSMPTQAIVAIAMLALHRGDKPFVWPTIKPTEHMKRVGMSVSCRFLGKSGHKPTVSGVLMFLPGLHMVHHMLPMIVLAPAVALTILQVALKLLSACEYGLEVIAAMLKAIINALALHARKASEAPSELPFFLQPFPITAGWRAVANYLEGKSNVFTFNYAFNKCYQCGTSRSSALQYDLQPYFAGKKKQ